MLHRIKNLDTFRAIAAIVVMIGHIELFRQNHWGSSSFDAVPSGHTAVMMFFVISGFLITFLLAWLSYETYEKFFLNLKKKFER